MKKFKQIDVWVSMSLILAFAIVSIIRFDLTFITGYFVVGGWQLISMLVHAINGWFCESGTARLRYHWTITITIMLILLGLAIYPLLFFILLALLFIAPFMAIGYTRICYHEVYVKMQRPMAVLK